MERRCQWRQLHDGVVGQIRPSQAVSPERGDRSEMSFGPSPRTKWVSPVRRPAPSRPAGKSRYRAWSSAPQSVKVRPTADGALSRPRTPLREAEGTGGASPGQRPPAVFSRADSRLRTANSVPLSESEGQLIVNRGCKRRSNKDLDEVARSVCSNLRLKTQFATHWQRPHRLREPLRSV